MSMADLCDRDYLALRIEAITSIQREILSIVKQLTLSQITAERSRRPEDQLLTELEAAKVLRISRITLLRARKRHEIGFVRLGSRVLYRREHLEKFLSERERTPRRR